MRRNRETDMKSILIVYTGGSIGMVPTANGYSPSPGVFRAALDAIGEMHHPDMPRWDFLELDPILDSSNGWGTHPTKRAFYRAFREFNPLNDLVNRVEAPRSGCFRAGAETGATNPPR